MTRDELRVKLDTILHRHAAHHPAGGIEAMSADDIKLPELPTPYRAAVYANARNTPAVKQGYEQGGYEKEPPLYTAQQMQDYARAAVLADRKGRQRDQDWFEFGKRFAIDLGNTRAAAEMVHQGNGSGPYEALMIGIELLAQHARLAMQQWQPIESAPMEGTPLLLYARHVGFPAPTVIVGHYDVSARRLGWVSASFAGRGVASIVPYRWMPLPAPPAARSTPATEKGADHG